jgi:hypothetical protein
MSTKAITISKAATMTCQGGRINRHAEVESSDTGPFGSTGSTGPPGSSSAVDSLVSASAVVAPGLVPPTGTTSPEPIGADPAAPDLPAPTLLARAIRVAAVIETDSALRLDSAASAAALVSGSTGICAVGVGSMYAMPLYSYVTPAWLP